MSLGFPDGDPSPSVTIDFRQVFIIQPVSGQIHFGLVPSPFGVFCLNTGVIDSQRVPLINGNGGFGGWAVKPIPTTATRYNQIAFSDVMAWGGDITQSAFGPYSASQFRCLMYAADVSYTGGAMQNGGTARVWKAIPAQEPSPPVSIGTGTYDGMRQTVGYSSNTSVSGLKVGPARYKQEIRSVSSKPTYRSASGDQAFVTTANAEYNPVVPFVYNGTTDAPATFSVGPQCDNSLLATYLSYHGLDASASITVDIRCCIQLQLRQGAFPGLAKPSPPADISLWQQVANYARSIPTSTYQTIGNAGMNMARGYFRGGAAGAALALMDH